MTEPREQRDVELTDLEFRADADALSFTGYAAVFNSDSQPLPFVERIAPGAFARTLKQSRDIKFLVDHNPERLLASTGAGTLRLAEDERGLRAIADLAPTSYGRDLKVLADRGEIRSMSFTFRPSKNGETWSEDGRQRTLTDVQLFEVSVLTGNPPAYPKTTAAIRSLALALDADVDALADAIDALAEGREITTEQLDLLEAAVRSRREPEPEPEPVPAAVRAALKRRRMALEATRNPA